MKAVKALLTEKVIQPVLVIAGKSDHAVGPEHHQRFKFQTQHVHIINGRHHPYIENQLEFKNAILDFISL